MWTKIINPVTNKNVNINSILGRKILYNYLKNSNKKLSNTSKLSKDNNYCIHKKYEIREKPRHYNDMNEEDKYQKEVYEYASKIMKKNNYKTVVDVGCGSAFKLIKYLGEYDTLGIETEPCYSMLIEKYPNRNWKLSGKKETNFSKKPLTYKPDLVICSDVIEHIIDPDELIKYLLSLDAKKYIISTPCRQRLCDLKRFRSAKWNGPPVNKSHVREWTMKELQKYLGQYFTILESKYCEKQKECQYHLLSKSN